MEVPELTLKAADTKTEKRIGFNSNRSDTYRLHIICDSRAVFYYMTAARLLKVQ